VIRAFVALASFGFLASCLEREGTEALPRVQTEDGAEPDPEE
jgi:hypothetical protein